MTLRRSDMTVRREVLEDPNIPIRHLRALSDDAVRLQLELTSAQVQQICTILRDGLIQSKPFRESLTEVQKNTVKKAVAVLTDEQRSQWEQMHKRSFEIAQRDKQFASRAYRVRGNRLGMQRKRTDDPNLKGGQRIDVSLEGNATNITIIRVEEFSEFLFERSRPLLIRGAAARATQRWTDEWLTNRFRSGECQISLDSRPTRGMFAKAMPLSMYLDGMVGSRSREYLFHTQRDPQAAMELLQDLHLPATILELGEPSLYRLFMGPALSGTLPHNHTYAINALARGRKRWAIYVGANPSVTGALLEESHWDYGDGAQAQEWFVRECPKLRGRRRVQLWEFIQEAGDLVYVPAFFIHAVVNLEPVVGFSVEFVPERRFVGGRPRAGRVGPRRGWPEQKRP